jgi:CRISPR/Cas system-associated endoribonuclease Cas2
VEKAQQVCQDSVFLCDVTKKKVKAVIASVQPVQCAAKITKVTIDHGMRFMYYD